ncbi:MAG: Septum formation protein Maf [Tenericutes bacterium ADurb.Bin239]|nr:MAG: Septum formation protein Maf [Tenericutes bacterium ADurb.Bin239]
MFILASKSPRRQELLKLIIKDFIIIVPNIDENIPISIPSDTAKIISKFKAYHILAQYPNATVLSCDTIVIIDGELLGKPKDAADARRMLSKLSGRKHHVISGFTLVGPGFEVNKNVVTEVFFNELHPEFIEAYIKSGSPFDKAGAYGIQDEEFNLVREIKGSYYNVMGLPVEELRKYIK